MATAQWGDPRILRRIQRESRFIRDPRARRVFLRAAVETGLVESGGRNLRGGDADSAGWRQERASLYRNPTNVPASVRRFRQEFEQVYRPGLKSYQAAAMIQRPREDLRGRYHDVAHAASRVLRGQGMGGQGGAGGPQGGVYGIPGSAGAQNVAMGSTGALDALAALATQKPPIQSAGLQSPSFSAAPRLPSGYQPPQSSGAPAPKLDFDALLAQIRTPGGDVQLAPGVPGMQGMDAVTGGAGSSGAGRGRGRVVVDPNANRPGAPLHKGVVRFAEQISAIAGQPIRIGTGTRHSRLTINGTVSDHWDGNGADIPKTGRGLIKLGQAALIAAGMDPKKARRIHGGGFNVGQWQVIFNTDAPGWGDHTTHLHIGRRRR